MTSTVLRAKVMAHAEGGYSAFLDDNPKVSARGRTVYEAEENMKLPFAEYVVRERREGRLRGEIVVIWIE